MDDNAEDCSVCLTAFDNTVRRPRNLPCGHTFCTLCINALKDQGQVTCPTCRVAHSVPEAGQFAVSYITEALIRRLRDAASFCPPLRPEKDTGEPALSPATESGQKGPAGLSMPIQSMLQEQEAKVLSAIRTCQEVQVQLDQYHTTLVDWSERQQNLEDRLQALLDQSKDARVLVRWEDSQVEAKKEQLQQGEKQLHALLQTLRTLATEQEVGVASVKVVRCIDEERQRADECRGMFPDVHTVTTINKVREASSAALEAAMTVQSALETPGSPCSAAGDPDFPGTPDFSILDKLEVLLTATLKTEDLRNLTQPARNLLQAGLVFGVHSVQGRRRHARISLEDGRLYLHSLQDQPLPSCAVTVQVDELVPAAPPCLVFLDLAWPGSAPRRVLVRLNPDTPRGRQFLMFCTGQRGPSYTNTVLWKVVDKGRPGERVYAGDYENNDGTGGAALLSDLGEGMYRRSCMAGAVWGWCSGSAQGAVFGIITRDWHGCVVSGVFGEVVCGLEDVAAAAQHRPITEVTVVDCGVVLWE